MLNLISVYGFPPWRSDIEGNMLVDGENVDKMRGWLERNKEKGRNVQFDHLQALILPFIAHMDADELEKARDAESLRELEIIMSQEREAQLEEARLRGQAMPEPVMEPKPAKLIRKPALAPNLKKVKTSKLFKIAEFLEKRRVTTDPNGQVKRAAEVLIKETSQITGIPMEDDRNWKVAQIAVLESINRKFEQVGQEELRQAVTLVNSRAAIKTREAGLTSKNLALVKIAALLGDAEELHDAYEWIKGEENVVSAERRALLQWEQQHDMAMAANGGIDSDNGNL